MRNIFDQYSQPENRLTNALVLALHHDRKLIRPFLSWLGVHPVSSGKKLCLDTQTIPNSDIISSTEEDSGLPDICFYDNDNWAVIIESKVQSQISVSQLRRHVKTLQRAGYEKPQLFVFAVKPSPKHLPNGAKLVLWKDIYKWFWRRMEQSFWAKHFVEYMQVFEAKMVAENYTIDGSLTMFSGFRFTEDNPYTYNEGKRLIKIIGDEFRKDRRLRKHYKIDLNDEGRSSITRGEGGRVWDYIGLKKKSGNFTSYPHLTMGIRRDKVIAAITIPNGIKGGIKTKLKKRGLEEFHDLLLEIEKQLRPILRKIEGAVPCIYLIQRHSKSQKSMPIEDGRLEVDLRAMVKNNKSKVKYQPMWTESIYSMITHKKANIQMGIEVRLPVKSKIMQEIGRAHV
jgi:hypothetical protein